MQRGSAAQIVWLACALLAAGSGARADGPSQRKAAALPRATLFATRGATSADAPLNAIMHAALEELNVVVIVAAPGMDMGAVQLAIDCVGQTPHCLKAVAEQNHSDVLLSPSLQRLPNALVLSVLRFDARADGGLRRVLRRQRGNTLGPELLDAVPDMLRDLFDVPRPEPRPEPVASEPVPPPQPIASAAQEARAVPIGPLIVAGAGVLTLIAGGVVGVAMNNQQDEYDRRRQNVDTKSDALAAVDTRETGETLGIAADVLFAVGGAAVVAGGIWLALVLTRAPRAHAKPTARVTPLLGPGRVGLVWTERGGFL